MFGLEWTADYLNFTIDGKLIGSRGVPPGGFWKLGGFDKIPGARNIWKDGKPMAPFDKKVITNFFKVGCVRNIKMYCAVEKMSKLILSILRTKFYESFCANPLVFTMYVL